jgi:hypothetical protein
VIAAGRPYFRGLGALWLNEIKAGRCATRVEARTDIFEYVGAFYDGGGTSGGYEAQPAAVTSCRPGSPTRPRG